MAAAAIEAGIQCTRDLVRELEIPGLGRYGLSAERIPAMVALARQASSMRYNPAVLDEETLGAILGDAL